MKNMNNVFRRNTITLTLLGLSLLYLMAVSSPLLMAADSSMENRGSVSPQQLLSAKAIADEILAGTQELDARIRQLVAELSRPTSRQRQEFIVSQVIHEVDCIQLSVDKLKNSFPGKESEKNNSEILPNIGRLEKLLEDFRLDMSGGFQEGSGDSSGKSEKEVSDSPGGFDADSSDWSHTDKMGNFEVQELMSRATQARNLASSITKGLDKSDDPLNWEG